MPAGELRAHVIESHKMAEYRYQCDRCNKRFDKRTVIRNHYREDNITTKHEQHYFNFWSKADMRIPKIN
jgi:hypothetical protein